MGIFSTISNTTKKLAGALAGIVKIIAQIPAIIAFIESISKPDGIQKDALTGPQKHAAVESLVRDAILSSDEFTDKDIADEDMFSEGVNNVIDGIVKMLNASVWQKKAAA